MDGFQGFRAEVDRVSTALGGGAHTRMAVATVFIQCLDDAVNRRLGLNRFGLSDLPHSQVWTFAEDADFAMAVRDATEGRLRVRERNPVTASADLPGGARLVVRGDVASVEAGGFRLAVAMLAGETSPRSGCSVFLTDSGKEYLWGSRYGGTTNKPTSVRLQKATNAERSLRSLVEGFFRVRLVEPETAPAPID